jgi:hypothetical protein
MRRSISSRLRMWLALIVLAAIGLAVPHSARAETPLDRAYRVISSKKFVDLTHSFGPGTPVW